MRPRPSPEKGAPCQRAHHLKKVDRAIAPAGLTLARSSQPGSRACLNRRQRRLQGSTKKDLALTNQANPFGAGPGHRPVLPAGAHVHKKSVDGWPIGSLGLFQSLPHDKVGVGHGKEKGHADLISLAHRRLERSGASGFGTRERQKFLKRPVRPVFRGPVKSFRIVERRVGPLAKRQVHQTQVIAPRPLDQVPLGFPNRSTRFREDRGSWWSHGPPFPEEVRRVQPWKTGCWHADPRRMRRPWGARQRGSRRAEGTEASSNRTWQGPRRWRRHYIRYLRIL